MPDRRYQLLGASGDVAGELVIRWPSGQQGRRTVHAAKAVRPHPSARSFPQVPGRDGSGGFRCAGQASPRPPSRARDGTGLAGLSGRPGLSGGTGRIRRAAGPPAPARPVPRSGRPARRTGAHRLTLARRFAGSRSTVRAGYSGATARSGRVVGRSPGQPEPAGTPGRPRCAPGRPGRGSVKRPRTPPRSAGRPRPGPAAPSAARWYERRSRAWRRPGASLPDTRAAELARVAAGVPRQPDGPGRSAWRPAGAASHAGLPFAAAHPRERPLAADGRRHCGSLEAILWRQWDPASPPPREVVAAVDRLAELPERIKERLADGLDAHLHRPGRRPGTR